MAGSASDFWHAGATAGDLSRQSYCLRDILTIALWNVVFVLPTCRAKSQRASRDRDV